MSDPESEHLTEEMRISTANTARLPRLPTAESDTEDFSSGQSRVLQMIVAGAPLKDILTRLVLLIEAQSPDMLCSVLLLSDDGNHIRHGAAPGLPDDYVKAIDGSAIGPKQGSCGTAMFRGQRVIVSDIMVDPLWEDFRALAAPAGLRACWSTPILSGRGKVLGSFAMYYREPRTPTGEESGLTEVATRIAGLAIEHQAARETLARTQAALTKVNQSAATDDDALAIAPEVTGKLEAIANDADRCLATLDDHEPNVERLREALARIAFDTRQVLETIIRASRQIT